MQDPTDLSARAAELVRNAQNIVVLQAENPDGDSLGSAIALEEALGEAGKNVSLYCHMQVPKHLRYIKGWDRVSNDFPRQFDLAIIVDTSVQSLFEKTFDSHNATQLSHAHMVVFDHHRENNDDDHLSKRFSNALVLNDSSYVATCELLYDWLKQADFPLPLAATEALMCGILSDSLGFMSSGTSAHTLTIASELLTAGVSIADLDFRRKEFMRKSPEILAYKARLIDRIEYHLEGQLALVRIPWEEIAKYSDQYNPSMLVLDEMRLVEGVRLAIAIKTYPDGKLTAKIRTNPNGAVADKIAQHFGAGGHAYAAGFKLHTDDAGAIVNELIGVVDKALAECSDKEPC